MVLDLILIVVYLFHNKLLLMRGSEKPMKDIRNKFVILLLPMGHRAVR